MPTSFAYPYSRNVGKLGCLGRGVRLKVAYKAARGASETLSTSYLLPRLRVSATTGVSGILWLVRRVG
jgi:hypothetical protein